MSRQLAWSLVVTGMALAPAAWAGHDRPGEPAAERAGEAKQGDAEARESPPAGEDVRTAGPGTSGSAPATGMATTESRKAEELGTPGTESNDLIRKLYGQSALDAETARIALQKSRDERVTKLADEIARDHKRLGEKLEGLGEKRHLELRPETALSSGQKAHVEAMKGMGTPEFEAHFAEMMAQDHAKLMSDLDAALEQANRSGDRELAAVVQEVRPSIAEHHAAATSLRGSPAGSVGSSESTGGAAPSSAGSAGAGEAEKPDKR